MNIYALIILITIFAKYFLHLFADLLNLKTLGNGLPDEFKEVFSDEAYKKSQEYTRARALFGIITSSFGLSVTLIFWLSGCFNYLDQLVRSWQLPIIWTGIFYIGVLLLARTIVSLPFSIYSTFVIEERFGFNKTTPATFIKDLIKGLLLGIVIGGPLLFVILAFFEYAGPLAWLYCWIAATAFTLILQFIAPTWIMPLFNKFTPLEEGDLKESILSYAESVKFSLKDVFVMDGSKRSSKSNAFFTGFGKNKRIALFDTLIQKHTVPELVAVLAHEIGHYKKKHIIKNMAISIVHMGLIFFLLSIFVSRQELFNAFFMEHASVYAGIILFSMVFTQIEFFFALFINSFSRKNEYEADRFAAETTGKTEAMINALKKLSVDNLSHLTPHPFYVKLNYSHPPVLERIKALSNR